jgi:hypothetical protein
LGFMHLSANFGLEVLIAYVISVGDFTIFK